MRHFVLFGDRVYLNLLDCFPVCKNPLTLFFVTVPGDSFPSFSPFISTFESFQDVFCFYGHTRTTLCLKMVKGKSFSNFIYQKMG